MFEINTDKMMMVCMTYTLLSVIIRNIDIYSCEPTRDTLKI